MQLLIIPSLQFCQRLNSLFLGQILLNDFIHIVSSSHRLEFIKSLLINYYLMLDLWEINKPLGIISLIGLLLILFILILIFELLLNFLTHIVLLQLPVFPFHFKRFLPDVLFPLFLFMSHVVFHSMKLQIYLIPQMDTLFGIQSQIIQIFVFLLNDFF